MGLFNIFKKTELNETTSIEIIKTNNELNNKKAYFSNDGCFSNETDFLKGLIKIITNKEEYYLDENTDFDDVIEYLLKNEYLIKCNNSEELIQQLKEKYNEIIDEIQIKKETEKKFNHEAIKQNIIEKIICEQLEKRDKGLIYLYSAGDYYCYGVVNIGTISKLKELFKKDLSRISINENMYYVLGSTVKEILYE